MELEEDFISSKVIPSGRKVWELAPQSGGSAWTLLFLDAELYIERVDAPTVVRELQQAGNIPSVHSLFVSNENAAARHVDYTCNPTYSRFLTEDVLSWLTRKHPDMRCNNMVIVGLSLSGLASAFAATQYSDQFPNAICQSPSFWWNDEWFRQTFGEQRSRTRFWISVGNLEKQENVTHPPTGMMQRASQIDACRRTWDLLKSHGYVVRDHIFDGSHDPNCWREDLALALSWALEINAGR
jgi:enterochelin esterase-like enzyme